MIVVKISKMLSCSYCQHFVSPIYYLVGFFPFANLIQITVLKMEENVKRSVKNHCVTLNNKWLRWLELHAESLTLVQEIANLRISMGPPTANAGKIEDVKSEQRLSLLQLDQKCENLMQLLSHTNDVVKAVENSHHLLTEIRNLLEYRGLLGVAVFKNWTIDRYLEGFEKISEMLRNEHQCRNAVLETLPFAENNDLIMVCVSSWTHQPYINETFITSFLHSILFECELSQ